MKLIVLHDTLVNDLDFLNIFSFGLPHLKRMEPSCLYKVYLPRKAAVESNMSFEDEFCWI